MTLCAQYEKEGNWEEAKKLCEQAHQLDPTGPMVADELAFLYLEHGGDVNVALGLAQQAKQRSPNSPVTADVLGWAYYKLGSPESAVTQLKDSVQLVPKNPVFQYHLGMAYLAAGHRDLAQRSLQTALKENPNFLYAASAKANLDQLLKPLH
jgi:tetratricopeptide (TPR) repeat protein